jgi:uncharacterized protein involved in exopolysaccharide biosynthesis
MPRGAPARQLPGFGDNADSSMTVDHESTPTAIAPNGLRGRLHPLARRVLWRVARPYAQLRAREAEIETSLAHLQSDSKRHTEQIARLEDITRELILTAESLRRAVRARRVDGDG